jgi:hypothetical protein
MSVIKRIPIWKCDRCEKEIESENRPSTESDPWGTLMIDQPSGFDFQGCHWSSRMSKPLLLCGQCIEDVVKVVNQMPERKS